jgi:hypothetical protein
MAPVEPCVHRIERADCPACKPGGGGDQMVAIMLAARRVRGGRWMNGAPSHVLADLLNELQSMGWTLRRDCGV